MLLAWEAHPVNQITLARGHGLFNAVGGLWPLLHMRSFEWLFGPKVDRWLVRTVAGLMLANGIVQVGAVDSDEALTQARRIGLGTALTLGAIDLVYAPRGRISKMYLVDAALEAGWVLAWLTSRRPRPRKAAPDRFVSRFDHDLDHH